MKNPPETHTQKSKPKYWAGLKAKRKEVHVSSSSGAWWKTNRFLRNKDSASYTDLHLNIYQRSISRFRYDIEHGHVVALHNLGKPDAVEIQEIVNEMASQHKIEPSPIVYLDMGRARFPYCVEKRPNAVAHNASAIIINQAGLARFGKDRAICRAIMAHELAHIKNQDESMESWVAKQHLPPTQAKEILADRLGAIIYRNPRQYAELTAGFLKAGKSKAAARSDDEYLSPNATARMLHKWADILEREGAADKKTGYIINRKKALGIFERSKEFTNSLANIDSFSRI